MLNYQDFSRGAMFIMTNQMKKIDKVVILKCRSEQFPVRVTEVADDVVSLFHCFHDSYKEKKVRDHTHVSDSSFANSLEDEHANCSENVGWYIGKDAVGSHADAVSNDTNFLGRHSLVNEGVDVFGSSVIVPETELQETEDIPRQTFKVGEFGNLNKDGLDNELVANKVDEACLQLVTEEDDKVDGPILSPIKLTEPDMTKAHEKEDELDPKNLINSKVDPEELFCRNNTNHVGVFLTEESKGFEQILKNKRGAKLIADIENTILAKLAQNEKKRGKKSKNVSRYIQASIPKGKIVNSSLSDFDFKKKRRDLCKDATDAWEI
ncbi:hypothetical protein REPUB_Repub03eG0202700 [Reevesia pubescens]